MSTAILDLSQGWMIGLLAWAKTYRSARRDLAERRAIAKAFNDRYCYRHMLYPDDERLPGTSMFGINPRGGYRWMCPECNHIHAPESSSLFSGLQYPACCSTVQGHRLDAGIRLP
jgi:hypothetical protein